MPGGGLHAASRTVNSAQLWRVLLCVVPLLVVVHEQQGEQQGACQEGACMLLLRTVNSAQLWRVLCVLPLPAVVHAQQPAAATD